MDYAMIGIGLVVFLFITLFICITFRRVVQPNEVHIVQRSKTTTSYGKDTRNGNTYYEWPHWLPVIGMTKVILPVSVFNLALTNYDAYDKDRVPFVIDVISFFRISDTNVAAQRVSHFQDLQQQLTAVLKGAIRTVLANSDLDQIMTQRATFGESFTKEVENQLENWGVVPVKNIELMDIRDSAESEVISNIMAKKKSLIESQSRIEVAKNMQDAKIAEIKASQEMQMQDQATKEAVGVREAEKTQKIGIRQAESQQAIATQNAITKQKEMEVVSVEHVRAAEIDKNAAVIAAEQAKQVQVLTAEGTLEAKKREAEGIQIAGLAKAEAEKALQLAPVTAQITLAKEIGTNDGYQKYLVDLRTIEANQAVGMEQAKSLQLAEIKVIANAGAPAAGIKSVMDLFSSQGGTSVGAMLQGLAQSEEGKGLLAKVGINLDPKKPTK